MVQCSQINKCNIPYKPNEGQKPHDHTNKCRETFDKMQHPLMIKTLSKVEIEKAYLNIIKAIYEEPTANIIHSG